MTTRLQNAVHRYLSGGGDGTGADGGGEEEESFGVHITYEDLYDTIVFFTCIYVAGQIASRLLRMPDLVGEIVAGILLGPPLADYVPNPEAFVLLGEVGLVLLVVEAGIDIDVSTLKLIGTRGFLIAIVGSILPIAIGILVAVLLAGTGDIKSVLSAGAVFGPTSLGIALNILRSGGILNTPVGQLIVSAAVIDDMIALIVLSQLESLTGTIDAAGILIPVVSAVVFLVVGGYLALYVAPGVVEQYVLRKVEPEHHGKVELALMFAILLAMMPATHYAKASYLMGAFVAGLAFCTSHELHATFVQQFKRIMQWLMRIFFAASIGFQVPVKDFADGTVVWQGMVFTVALLGKLAVGFMVPNFTQSKHFTGLHLRDCLITGFSMAAEGEFAFVIAVFAVDNELIDKDLYASVVLAVLMSTIIPPFLLKFTIGYYNRKAHETVRKLANEEMELLHDLESEQAEPADLEGISKEEREAKLAGEIRNQRAVFLCIQTQSEASWGLLHLMMATVAKLGLDIIDHRSWHPRGINTTLVNEIYCKDKISVKGRGQAQAVLEERMLEIKEALEKTIKQPETSKTQVSRWFPGVVEEIVERVNHKEKVPGKKVLSLEQRLLREASTELDKKQNMQLHATHERSVEEILSGMQKAADLPAVEEGAAAPLKEARRTKRAPRHRQKMRSTPVVGGGLFGESKTEEEKHEEQHAHSKKPSGGALDSWKADFGPAARNGHKAEIIVNGESYDIRINDATMRALQAGFSGDMLDSRGVSIHGALSIEPDSSNVVSRLQGYVRSSPAMGMITEETVDGESETSSVSNINPV